MEDINSEHDTNNETQNRYWLPYKDCIQLESWYDEAGVKHAPLGCPVSCIADSLAQAHALGSARYGKEPSGPSLPNELSYATFPIVPCGPYVLLHWNRGIHKVKSNLHELNKKIKFNIN